MANKGYGYQYGTSPRKIEPEFTKKPVKKKKPTSNKKMNNSLKKKNAKKSKKQAKKKFKISFEVKFFINSMIVFCLIFAMIALQAFVDQKYKEKQTLKNQYDEMVASMNLKSAGNEDIHDVVASYGMETKSVTLISLEKSDYIESSNNEIKIEDEGIWNKIANWFKEIF